MRVIIGPAASDYATEKEQTRISIAEHRHQAGSKEGRSARRLIDPLQFLHFVPSITKPLETPVTFNTKHLATPVSCFSNY